MDKKKPQIVASASEQMAGYALCSYTEALDFAAPVRR
jgi:hypothetical protein